MAAQRKVACRTARIMMFATILSSTPRYMSHVFVNTAVRPAFRPAAGEFLARSTTRLFSATTDEQEISRMRAGEIKKELESYGINTKAFLEKSELVQALQKARSEGLKPKAESSSTSTSSSQQYTASSTHSDSKSGGSRDERLKEELAKCQAMKAYELKKELRERGVSISALFEKSELVQALAKARVDGKERTGGSGSDGGEGYAEYKDVEVLTDDASGPRQKRSEPQQQQGAGGNPFGGGGANPFGGFGGGSNPFGGSSPFGGGANPFAGAAGMGGMGGMADMLKNMGGGGAGAQNPFQSSAGMSEYMVKMQQAMKNPKFRDVMMKAQSNPRINSIIEECISNPEAMKKYANDPELQEVLAEVRKVL